MERTSTSSEMPRRRLSASSIALLPPAEKTALLQRITDRQFFALLRDWTFLARDNQLPPIGDWIVWLVLAGRGFGKTRTGAEWIRARVKAGKARRIHLIAPTAFDARTVMVEGDSGILSVCHASDLMDDGAVLGFEGRDAI